MGRPFGLRSFPWSFSFICMHFESSSLTPPEMTANIVLFALRWGAVQGCQVFSTEKRRGRFSFCCRPSGTHHPLRAAVPDARRGKLSEAAQRHARWGVFPPLPMTANPLPCPGAQRCTKQLASERSSSALCTTASQNQGIGPSRPQGCGGARDGRRVPQGRQRKKIPASLFSVEKTKCLPHAKPMICNQARRPSTNSQRYQNDSRHSGIGLW